MRIALIVLGLLGVINASPLNYDSAVEKFGTFDELKREILPNIDEEENASSTTPPNRPETSTRPPQVHHNTVFSQGPFSRRLVNVLLNEGDRQETYQRNRVAIDIEGVKRILSDDFQNYSE